MSEFSASDKRQNETNERNKSLTATIKSATSRDRVKWHAARGGHGSSKRGTGDDQGHPFSHQAQGDLDRRRGDDRQNGSGMQFRGWERAGQTISPRESGVGGE